MSTSNEGYERGQWNAVCDQCGLRYKSSEMVKRWDGAMVCTVVPGCYEERQPQDFVRAVLDDQSTEWVRDWIPLFYPDPLADSAVGEVEVGSGPAIGGY